MEKLIAALLEFFTEVLKKFGGKNGNGHKVTTIFESLRIIISQGNVEMANVFKMENGGNKTAVTILYEDYDSNVSESIKSNYQTFLIDNDMKMAVSQAEQIGYISFKTGELPLGVRRSFYERHQINYAEIHYLYTSKNTKFFMAINSRSGADEFKKNTTRWAIEIAVSNIKNALSGRKK